MKKISFEIKDEIYDTMKSYSDFSGVSIPSMIKNAIIGYLTKKELIEINIDKPIYKELKEAKPEND